jgi:hypothetical protein
MIRKIVEDKRDLLTSSLTQKEIKPGVREMEYGG